MCARQGLLQLSAGASLVQALSQALLAAGSKLGSLGSLGTDGRPLALMPDIKVRISRPPWLSNSLLFFVGLRMRRGVTCCAGGGEQQAAVRTGLEMHACSRQAAWTDEGESRGAVTATRDIWRLALSMYWVCVKGLLSMWQTFITVVEWRAWADRGVSTGQDRGAA